MNSRDRDEIKSCPSGALSVFPMLFLYNELCCCFIVQGTINGYVSIKFVELRLKKTRLCCTSLKFIYLERFIIAVMR